MWCGVFRNKDSKGIAIILGVVVILGIIIGFAILSQAEGKQYVEQAVMAENYLKAGNYQQAAEYYQKALSAKGSDQEQLSVGLADAYIGLNEYDNALEVLRNCYRKTSGIHIKEKIEEVISKKADYEYLQFISRADIYLSNMEYDKAIAEYEKAKLIKSKEVTSYQKIAEAYLENGNYELAREEVLEGQALTQSEELAVTLEKVDAYIIKKQYDEIVIQAGEYILQENYEEGMNAYRDAILLLAKEPAAYMGLAEVYLSQSKYDEAVALLETAKKNITDNEIEELYEKASDMKQQKLEREEYLSDLFDAMEEPNTGELLELFNQPLYNKVMEDVPIYYQKGATKGSGGLILIIYEAGDLYLGEQSNGLKKGKGTYFLNTENKQGTGYYYYQGEWDNDIPNGKGKTVEESIQIDSNNKSYTSKIITEGAYYNGTENDVMKKYFFKNGTETGRIEYKAQNGIPALYSGINDKKVPTPEAESYVIARVYLGGELTGEYYSVEPQTIWGVKPFLKKD